MCVRMHGVSSACSLICCLVEQITCLLTHLLTCLICVLHLCLCYLLQGHLYDRSASDVSYSSVVLPYAHPDPEYLANPAVLIYNLDIYPSRALMDSYKTSKPILYTTLIGGIFFVMAVTFFMFNRYIQQRNKKVVRAAARSNAIVSTIFPSNIRERLYNDVATGSDRKRSLATSSELKQFIRSTTKDGNNDEPDIDEDIISRSKPIADLFPEVRV
jgi:hypothetical protein